MSFYFLGYIAKDKSFYASLHAGPLSQDRSPMIKLHDENIEYDERLTISSISEWR